MIQRKQTDKYLLSATKTGGEKQDEKPMATPHNRPNSGFWQASNNFWDGWLKNPKPAMIRCNDGFQPVSFCIEALDENAD